MRRPGITLLEVLAAIFITGIGLLSLLTLFPLGALTMLRAVQDDRAAQAGDNAKAIANSVSMRLDPNVQTLMLNQLVPGATVAPGYPAAQTPTADGSGFLVLVDPIGVYAYNGQVIPGQTNWPAWLGGAITGAPAPLVCSNVQRVTGTWLKPLPTDTSAVQALDRWCTLQDDLNFNSDGAYQGLTANPPSWVPGGGLGVIRNLRYSYAWLCRMPRVGAPNVVDVTTLVFSGRSIDFVGLSTQEGVFTVQFLPGQNQVVLPVGANPDVRHGQWILDSTTTASATGALSTHGFFYRVENVSTDPTTGQMVIEVQSRLRGWPDANVPTVIGTLVILDNLLEVFEDGTF
jgi:hypothetical protein